MLSSKNNNVNDLLEDDSFIAWVTSNYKIDHIYWSKVEASLSKTDRVEFANAIDILKKLKTLHIDDEKSIKPQEFIKQQYVSLMKDYAQNEVKRTRVVKLRSLLKYAAILVLLISISGVLYFSNNVNNTFGSQLVETAFNTSDVLLQTPDDTYYVLSGETNKSWLNENGVLVDIKGDAIHFILKDQDRKLKGQDYKIIVPEGKKYMLTMVDGTSVELNSNSSITFTNTTSSTQRNVSLIGEAFFDVAHNESRPFVVQSSDLRIQVLGTEFNVSNYETNGYTSATLVDGSIEVSNQQGENKVISPGTQALLVHNQSEITITKVNVQKAVSWTKNRMIFEDETLENIIQKLSVWYPEKFILNDENIKQYRFTGTLKKENNLSHFLQMLKYTEGISYKIDKDEITLFFE